MLELQDRTENTMFCGYQGSKVGSKLGHTFKMQAASLCMLKSAWQDREGGKLHAIVVRTVPLCS